MSTLALVLLGIVAADKIPTSLLPEIDIPEISIHISYPNSTARELETNVVRNIRNQLLQISHLEHINTETRDGFSLIKLKFDYGTNIDYSFIEVNEKIDAAANFLPKDMERPKVIKASASDIPVLNILISLKDTMGGYDFIQLSEFSQTVLKKRIEQLPEVALADISGTDKPEIQIVPDLDLLRSLNANTDIIVNTIRTSNLEPGDFVIKNGIYQYNFKFDNPLRSIDDIKNIYLKINNRLLQLKDIASVKKLPYKQRGKVYGQGQRSIVFSVIKQANARVGSLKKSLKKLISEFKQDYPYLYFSTNQDRTSLLQYSLNNLKWSLILGSILAIIIMFFFVKEIRSPLIISLTIPLSLILTIFLMYVIGISINIISLSGLILGVGMMIDNSIIVIDNINQKIERGEKPDDAIIEGTNEIISPLITSVLTTISVFLPLLFLSGITGALFYEQALAVTLGLGISLFVSILFIPVAFRLFYRKTSRFRYKSAFAGIEKLYEKGYKYFVDFKYITLLIAFAGIFATYYFFKTEKYTKLPQFQKNETVLKIDWNENINLDENISRTGFLIDSLVNDSTIVFSQFGEQQFLLQREKPIDLAECKIYIKTKNPDELYIIQKEIEKKISDKYPEAKFRFEPVKTVFEKLFGDKNDYLQAQISSINSVEIPRISLFYKIDSMLNGLVIGEFSFKKALFIHIDFERMLLFDVSYDRLVNELKSAFNENIIDNLKSEKRYIPIKLDYNTNNLKDILNGLFVENKKGEMISVKSLVRVINRQQYKTIYANRKGEYLPFKTLAFSTPVDIIRKIDDKIRNSGFLNVRFSGSFFEINKLKKELLIVILISLLLLYFIMAAQFESFILPVIILMEIPIDIGGALLLNHLFGGTINVMTAIGIVVMSGVVINDSILKIHTINMLIKQGFKLKNAILTGGKYRLKPIIMTSLTTILALLPFLFFGGMGSELQKPLALTVIGGLFLGTFISLYFIPMMYGWMYKTKK